VIASPVRIHGGGRQKPAQYDTVCHALRVDAGQSRLIKVCQLCDVRMVRQNGEQSIFRQSLRLIVKKSYSWSGVDRPDLLVQKK
jgi:hypothetical protein